MGSRRQAAYKNLIGVDLFCGVGGLSAGLARAGINIVAGYDSWEVAVKTYNRNMDHEAYQFDLLKVHSAVKAVQRHAPDILVGGPPCQDFSTAGKREEGDRASLTIAYAKIVTQCKVPFALMENVPQARLSVTYSQAKRILRSAGYQIWERVLDASFCGVPQRRKRFFMVAWLGHKPLGRRLDSWIEDNSADAELTVKEYLKSEIEIKYYYRHPRNYSRRAIFTVHEPSPTIRGVNRPVPPNYKRNHLDSADPRAVRPLTSLERSRVQTFPASWDWSGGDLPQADVELLIGNAVPVELANFMGRGLLHAAR